MSSNTIRYISWGVACCACVWLALRLLTYDHWDSLITTLGSAGWRQTVAVVAALLLMPLNLLCEALRWQLLLHEVCPLTLCEAFRQVLYGMTGAVFTPARVGEYPARVLRISDTAYWPEAVMLGFVGSAALTLVIILAALALTLVPHAPWWPAAYDSRIAVPLFAAAALALLFLPQLTALLARLPWRRERLRRLCTALAAVRGLRWIRLLLLTALRYVVWCLQLFVLLAAFAGTTFTLTEIALRIPVYYLLVTCTPSVPAADIAVRGSWLMVVLGNSTNEPVLLLIAALLWAINTLLPTLAALFTPILRADGKTSD